jgi:ketopantoate hydroxymethyltransferase
LIEGVAMQTIINLYKEKFQKKEKISVVTCYDASFAKIISETDMDTILVGDSLGMVVQGHNSTMPVTLEEMIDNLTKRITQGLRMKFSEFSGSTNKVEKVNVIVSFLAMLELVKQGVIHVSQDKNFSDIHMESKEIGVPRYN